MMIDTDPYEPERRARLALIAALLAGVLAVLTAVFPPGPAASPPASPQEQPDVSFAWSGTRETRQSQLEQFVRDYFHACSPRKLARALALVPEVIAATQEQQVNPAIVGAIISLESTWDPEAVGALGEVGLMQVGRTAGVEIAPGVRGQLDAGLSVLRRAYETCGTVEGALSLYATGRNCTPYRGARLRMALARRIETYEGNP